MDAVTRDSFRERLAALSPDGFESFVADLWTARGRELRRTGRRIVARSPETDAVELLYVLPSDGDLAAVPGEGTDAVVAARPPSEESNPGSERAGSLRVIDADELRRIALYAIDRDAAVRLLTEHLGYETPRFPTGVWDGRSDEHDAASGGSTRPRSSGSRGSGMAAPGTLEVNGTPGPDAGDSRGTNGVSPDAPSPLDRRSAVTGGVALAGLAVVGLGARRIGRWATPPGGQTTSDDVAAVRDAPDSTAGTSSPAGARRVPGLTSDGVVDPPALAEAHVRRLHDTSYTLEVERTVRGIDGSLRSMLSVSVALARDRTYVARAETAGQHAPRFLGTPPARAAFWSEGQTYLRRFSRGNETTYNQFEPPDGHVGSWRYWVHTVPFGGRDGSARAFVAALFGGVRARIAGRTSVNGREAYRLLTWGGRPDAGTFRFAGDVDDVDDVAVDALIDVDGLVSSLDLSYVGDHGGTPARVRRTVRYLDVGDTAVDRPAWYARAIEGETTASTSLETADG